ncbi:MAG: CoB--CoM heterodisulfide reductase iron-sulfur subunit B family protein [Candidatus Anammoxibacter sp.]
MMKIGYYPGCVLSVGSSAAEYGMSVRSVANALDIDLVDINDWNCCGASAAHQTNHMLAMSLSARNITLATNEGFNDVLVPCPACSLRFITAQNEIKENAELRTKIDDTIEMPYNDGIKILNFPEFAQAYCLDKLKEKVIKKTENLKVVCYYGCLLVRPPKVVEFDNPDDPVSMDEILNAIGVDALDWEFKTECCGGGLSMSRQDVVEKLVNGIMLDAIEAGADAIVVSCPLCHANLDIRQISGNQDYKLDHNLPIVYLSEIIGLTLGIESKSLGLKKHLIDTASVVESFN